METKLPLRRMVQKFANVVATNQEMGRGGPPHREWATQLHLRSLLYLVGLPAEICPAWAKNSSWRSNAVRLLRYVSLSVSHGSGWCGIS
jgi:hypothetical protein